MPVDAFGGEGIISEIEILRGDLADVLRQATLPGTEYIYDDTVTGLAQDEGGVTVTFEKAAPRRFGLVFGADGVHSAVRSVAFGPESEFCRPLNVCVSWFTADDNWDLDGWFLMYNEPGGLVASVRPGRLSGEIKASLAFRSPPVGDVVPASYLPRVDGGANTSTISCVSVYSVISATFPFRITNTQQ